MLDIEEFRAAVMDQPDLPRIPTPMILRRDEVAHLRVQRAVWRELRSSQGSLAVTGALAVIEMGQLYITNQRILLERSARHGEDDYRPAPRRHFPLARPPVEGTPH